MRKIVVGLLFLALVGFMAMGGISAMDGKDDYLIFCQAEGAEKAIYLYRTDQNGLQTIARAKNISVSAGEGWILYYADHKLYQYDAVQNTSKFLAQLTAEDVVAQVLPGDSHQALIIAKEDDWPHWYVLDLNDNSLRPVEKPQLTASSGGDPAAIGSPDHAFTARVRVAPFNQRITLEVQQQNQKGSKTIWRLPKNLTLLPEAPLWAPDAKNLAFYAKNSGGMEGFYSLYLLNPESLQLRQIGSQVFNRILFGSTQSGPYQPNWSHDGKSLLFSNQPYGLPTEREIVKYDVKTDKKAVITPAKGNYQYPVWSPSDHWIAVLAQHGAAANLLYLMGPQGENRHQISPEKGSCLWVKWLNFKESKESGVSSQ